MLVYTHSAGITATVYDKFWRRPPQQYIQRAGLTLWETSPWRYLVFAVHTCTRRIRNFFLALFETSTLLVSHIVEREPLKKTYRYFSRPTKKRREGGAKIGEIFRLPSFGKISRNLEATLAQIIYREVYQNISIQCFRFTRKKNNNRFYKK